MTVNIFIPCIVDQIYPNTAINMIRMLEHFGVETKYNLDQTCCGQFAYKSGYWDYAKELGEKFIKEFKNADKIISPTASCLATVKKYYPQLFHNTSQHNDLKALIPKLYEFTDFLVNVMNIKKVNASYVANIVIHESCSSTREYGFKGTDRLLLSSIRGVNIIDLPNADVCCGFGGSFSIKNPYISFALAEEKINNAISVGAEYIISTESSCLMHIQSFVEKNNIPIKPLHFIDFVAMTMGINVE